MTEQELAAKARAGDRDAFEQLVLTYQNRVYTLALRLTGDREEARDLAQEAFLRAWQGLPSFRGDSGFSTWLHRLTTNVCLDFLRRRTRQREHEPGVSLDDETVPEPADCSQDPQLRLERAELARTVERGLAALPEHYRQALVLRELSGLRYQEIAAALGVDMGTVKSRLARARVLMAKFLTEDGNISPPPPSKQAKKRGRMG